jgi:hypothetical protein
MDEQVVDTYFSSSGCSLHDLALQTLVQTCTDMQSCTGLYKSVQVCTSLYRCRYMSVQLYRQAALWVTLIESSCRVLSAEWLRELLSEMYKDDVHDVTNIVVLGTFATLCRLEALSWAQWSYWCGLCSVYGCCQI